MEDIIVKQTTKTRECEQVLLHLLQLINLTRGVENPHIKVIIVAQK
jgi:hypothetical protein